MSAVLKIDQIGSDPDLQMRESGLDAGIVAEYAEALNDGATFPPITVFFDGEQYWLADGFHRVGAVKKLGLETITADVRQGTRRDAMLHAVGVNAVHGLRRTAADKRRAIVAMLRDPQWARWSDREIGKRCAVDHKTVHKVRADLTDDFTADRTYITKHGTIATMSTAAIGKRTGDFPTDKPNGSMMGQMLAQVSDDALLAECRRRKLVVCDAH
jgi:ParB-like nuclease domain